MWPVVFVVSFVAIVAACYVGALWLTKAERAFIAAMAADEEAREKNLLVTEFVSDVSEQEDHGDVNDARHV